MADCRRSKKHQPALTSLTYDQQTTQGALLYHPDSQHITGRYVPLAGPPDGPTDPYHLPHNLLEARAGSLQPFSLVRTWGNLGDRRNPLTAFLGAT